MSDQKTTYSPDQIEHLREGWTRVQQRLKTELGDTIWKSWIKSLRLVDVRDGVATLATESKLTKNPGFKPIC